MKLQLLHGPALTSSRAKLISIKQKFDPNSVVTFEKGAEVSDIVDNLVSTSLFSDERLVIVENPPEDFALSSPSANLAFGGTLDSSDLTLLLWFDHEIGVKKAVLEWVKKEKGAVLFFPEAKEVSVFPFLDLLAYGDKKAFLEMDKLKKSGFDIQYFITMIFYLLRSLAITPKTAPQFVKQKLERQRKRFNLEDIKNLYRDVIEIDFKIKSGLLETSQAEFLLVNRFTSHK